MAVLCRVVCRGVRTTQRARGAQAKTPSTLSFIFLFYFFIFTQKKKITKLHCKKNRYGNFFICFKKKNYFFVKLRKEKFFYFWVGRGEGEGTR